MPPPLPESGVNNLWYDYNSSPIAVIFVHGILSDSRGCWLHVDPDDPQRNCYWPDLVRTDPRLGNPSIYLAGYYTAFDSGPYEIKDCAQEIAQALRGVDEAGRPGVMTKDTLVFVCHSTGGIVVRYLLESRYADFKDKRVGLVLLASPSYGSTDADRLGWLSRFYNQQQGIQLEWGNWSLRDLDTRFKTLVNERRIPALDGVEAYENHFVFHRKLRFLPDRKVVVTEESAGRYFGAPVLLRKTNHFTVAKPTGFRHPSHELLLDFWTREISGVRSPSTTEAADRPAVGPEPTEVHQVHAFGLELTELRQIHRYLNAAGDFEMVTVQEVTNRTRFDINFLLPESVSFFVTDPNDLKERTVVKCAIAGETAAIMSISPQDVTFSIMETTKTDGQHRVCSRVQWRPRVSPPLASGDKLRYTSTVTTRGTEEAVFMPNGSFAGFATQFPAARLGYRCEAPAGYCFDRAALQHFVRTEAGTSVNLPTLPAPVLEAGDRGLSWTVPQSAIEVAVNYLMRIRFVPIEGERPS